MFAPEKYRPYGKQLRLMEVKSKREPKGTILATIRRFTEKLNGEYSL